MLNLNPWLDFTMNFIVKHDEELENREYSNIKYIALNTVSYFATKMITEVLWKYCTDCNIPEDFRHRVNMKNEFLFSRIVMCGTKKRYVASINLQEGNEIYPEKIELKGVEFIKSTCNEETSTYFIELCKEKLLFKKEIDLSEVLKELENLENMIKDSLVNGEKKFLIPKSVKELEAYKDPFKEQGVRSVLAWNFIEEQNQLELPEKIDMVKMKLTSLDDLEKLKEVDSDIYEKIKRNIFEHPDKKISKKGMAVLAIPKNIKTLPEWVIPFIDYDTIVSDNLSKFFSILEGLEIEIIKNSNNRYFSNIINF